MPVPGPQLFAVHISSGVLAWPWLGAGFFTLGILVFLGMASFAARTRAAQEAEEVSRIALLTAVFFVAGLIHIKLGPTSVHLLLNGLVGILLRWRSPLAVAIGVTMQAFLLGHGDVSTIGVNSCVMIVPALLAAAAYPSLHNARSLGMTEASLAVSYVLYPWSVLIIGPLAIALKRVGRGLGVSAEFRAGFATGALAVAGTVALNAVVLIVAGQEDWRIWAAVSFAAHLPLAMIEGVITGFAVDFLTRVSPAMLPRVPSFHPSGNNSSSGTSH